MTSKQTNTFREEIEKLINSRDLGIGEIHAQGRELTHSDLDELNTKLKNQLLALFQKVVEKACGDTVDIQHVVNPTNTAAGNHYPNMVDLPMQSIADKLTGYNKAKEEIRASFKDIVEGKIDI